MSYQDYKLVKIENKVKSMRHFCY